MAEEPTRPHASPAVSVVVPCGGDLSDLEELVASLHAQDAPFPWEAVFVDNGLTTAERSRLDGAVRELAGARVVEAPRAGAGAARNAGARAARGDVLAFVDADDVAAPSWLRALTAAVAPGSIATGDLDVERLNPTWLAQTRGRPRTGGTYLCEGVFPVVAAGNMAMRRDDFDALGGFDPAFDALEDFELSLRAWRQGLAVRPAGADAAVHYRLRRDPSVLYRQGFRYGRGRARIYRALLDEGLVGRMSMPGWKSWAMLVVTAPLALLSRSRRAATAWILGNRVGRVVGSIRYRVVYL